MTTPRQRRLRLPGFLVGLRDGWSADAVTFTAIVFILVVFGLLMSFSASFVGDAAKAGDPFKTFRRQGLWAGVGLPLFFVAASIRSWAWRRLSWLLMPLALAGLAAVFSPIGLTEYGSTRWVSVGPLVAQPSELAKLATLLWLADVLVRKREYGIDVAAAPRHLLIPALPLLAVEAVLILKEPDLGTTVLVAGIVALLLFHEGLAWRWVAAAAGAGLAGVAVLTKVAPYRMGRIRGWLHAEEFAETDGYQLIQSLYALGNGGVFGTGIGAGSGKWNWVPNPETDFLFSVVGEETGLLGALAILGLFAGLARIGLRISRRSRDHFGRLVAYAVTCWVVGQALLNMSTVVGLLPITGVTLPLLSVGGTSLVATLVSLGIVVGVARSTATDI